MIPINPFRVIPNYKPLSKRRAKHRRGRKHDPVYLTFIRAQPCVVCESMGMTQTSRTEAAHVGVRGLGQKCSDHDTLPLCELHHSRGTDSHHRLGRHFWRHHFLNRLKLIRLFNERFEREQGSFVSR
jgi:hypothetical protein